MTHSKPPILDYRVLRVEQLKDRDEAVGSVEVALELADEDGCTDGLSVLVGDLAKAIGVAHARELIQAVDVGRPDHKAEMLSCLAISA